MSGAGYQVREYQPNGIDKFKMSFGGEVVQLKNCIFAKSIKGKLYVKLLKERDEKKCK